MTSGSKRASPLGWVALIVVATLLVIFYILPLFLIAREADFTATPSFSPKLAGAFGDYKDLSTLLRSIIVPVLVGLSAASVDRLLTLKTIILVVLLILGLSVAVVVLVDLNDQQAAINWDFHGLEKASLLSLSQFAHQSVESMLSYLALLAGIAIPKEKKAREQG